MAELRSVKIHLPGSNNGDSLEDGTGSGDPIVSNSLESPSVCYQARGVRSPPPKELESLNNGAVLRGSQRFRGSSSSLNTATTTTTTGSGLRKVPNSSPNSQKRNKICLTHLPRRPPVDIHFSDMSYSVSEGRRRGYKTILKCVNGKFRSGELTGIMGPSGAGKSTLMNILAGYRTSNLTGSVLINGKDRNLRRFRKMSCYIMQDDCLTAHLSVREALVVSANLKLGKDISKTEKVVVIDEVIETLGLQDCKDTQSQCLSGGQRKRLSIALELVNNPPVMFFDEPTSGLDSSSCFSCISLLKSLARGGRTIICTIHQPSARLFEMFDQLYMLAEGQCIYQGSVRGLVPFLSSMGLDCPSYHNPADYVMEVACGDHGDYVQKLVVAVNAGKCNNWAKAQKTPDSNGTSPYEPLSKEALMATKPEFSDTLGTNGVTKIGGIPTPSINCTTSLLTESQECMKIIPPTKNGFPTSGFQQFWILLKRTFFTQLRDQTLTQLRLCSQIIVGILLGMIYYDIGNDASKVTSNAGCLFFTIMFTMFTAMMPTILTFPLEMAVFVREHLNYWYSLKAYYFARTIADIPFQIILTAGNIVGVYYVTSQPLEPMRFAMALNISVLTALVAQSLGLLIGAGMSVEAGVYLGPVLSIPTVLFSGFFVNFNAIPYYLQWLPYISYVRYGFEGLMVAIYGMDRKKLQCDAIYCHFKSPKKFLEELSMENANYLVDALVLFGMFIALRIVAYFVLRYKLHSNR